MHELSIACNLVEIASQSASDAGVEQVQVVRLRLGALAGVVRESLLFSYDIAVAGTLLAGSRLEIEDVPVAIFCSSCQTIATLEGIQSFCCPRCGQPSADIRQGRELELIALEVADVQPPHT